MIAEHHLTDFRRALLRWYDHHRRALPWRRKREPYRIWVSEIMLQQTRVAAVLDHYRLFLKRFPNVRALAIAEESAVLATWSGLGYYRRARMMHQCAKEIAARHRARFPRTSVELRTLPGIGRYTSAAIASIAFGEPIALVDGNVERVVQRMSGRKLPPEKIWYFAQELLSKTRPGDFNQAMMELGATTCLPRQPICKHCPLRTWCDARGEMPLDTRQPQQTSKEMWCSLERRNGYIRMVRRSTRDSLMAGMWELPQSPKPREVPMAGLWRTFRHSITTTNYTVYVSRQPLGDKRGRWIAISNLAELPITGLTRKVLKADGII